MTARLYTRPTPTLHKSVDGSRMVVTAALSFPGADLAGDIVNPAGIDWTAHKAVPWVGLEHYRWSADRLDWCIPGPGDEHLPAVRVGTCRDPETGGYGVQLKALPEGPIPFGTTVFDPKNKLSNQTFGLVADGTLEGVSIEFRLIPGQYDVLGPSPLESRNAYRVHKCMGEGYVHCKQPVNPGALILKAGGSHPDHIAQAIRVAQTGRVGGEPAHPLILKSFARFLPGKSTTVTGGYEPRLEKAMPAADTQPAYTPDDAAPIDVDGAAEDAGGGDEISQVYDIAQQVEDVVAALTAIADATASVDIIKGLPKLAAMGSAFAEKVKAFADIVQGKVDAARGGKEDPEPADEPPDMDKDDEGVLKAMKPHHYRVVKALKARRISKAEHAAAAVVQPTTDPTLEYELAAAEAEAAAAKRRLAETKRWA